MQRTSRHPGACKRALVCKGENLPQRSYSPRSRCQTYHSAHLAKWKSFVKCPLKWVVDILYLHFLTRKVHSKVSFPLHQPPCRSADTSTHWQVCRATLSELLSCSTCTTSPWTEKPVWQHYSGWFGSRYHPLSFLPLNSLCITCVTAKCSHK